MEYKSEKNILRIIKYSPPIFIITLGVIISIFLYFDTHQQFKQQKSELESSFRSSHKEIIKSQVDRVHHFIMNKQKTTVDKLKKDIKQRVHEAYTIAMRIYNENKHLGETQVKKMIQDALVDIRFNDGRGYFFIYSFDYECILLPVARHLEGTNFYNFKDGKGKYLTRDIITQVKAQGEGYMTWWFHKPSDMKNQYKKIGFNIHFKPYNWFIGTGEYVEDVAQTIKDEVVSHVSKLKYPNDGYIFMIDEEKRYLYYPDPDFIGRSLTTMRVTYEIEKVIDDFDQLVQQGGGYSSYIHKVKPDGTPSVHKTSYVKGIENWDWIIGTGFYDDDLQAKLLKKKEQLEVELSTKLEKLMFITTILTVVLLMVSFSISRLLETMFKRYKDEIKLHLEENTRQQEVLAQNAKMAAMGEMIGNIAHQWRQPLSAISTAATGLKLQKEMKMLNDDDFEKSIDYINDSSQYLSKTIDDFRNFFKKDKIEKEFLLSDVYNHALRLVEVQFKNHEIEVVSQFEDVEILCLKNELIQVFINILNNARDELIKIDKPRLIIIKSSLIGKDIEVTIEDNAGGISDEIIDRVFEPYFTTKHQSQGTGIGLYMVEEIITKHMNSMIKIQNSEFDHQGTLYKGAKVTLYLKNVVVTNK